MGKQERTRRTDLKRRYGITPSDWEELFETQGRRCAICKTGSPGGRWNTDHCHDTGEVRGVLCHPCNLGLGQFRDNPWVLASAMAYLETNTTVWEFPDAQ